MNEQTDLDLEQAVERGRTVELRAAQYVGREDMPRRSVKLGPRQVLIVWDDPNVSALVYDETYSPPRSILFMLTDKRRAALKAALGGDRG